MNEVEEFCPKNQEAWRDWLEANHQKKEAIWLIMYRKHSAQYNLSWSDAVDEALCFGWIDSTKRTVDEECYKQYFTKRKPKSNWSKINKEKVKVLIEQGLMCEAGQKSIDVAMENGSWTALDSVEELVMPPALRTQLQKVEGALDYFERLSKSSQKILLHWVISARRDETKEKRIAEIVENAGKGMKPLRFR